MDLFGIFLIAGAVIFLGFVGETIFRKTNIPDVIWLIVFGILIGSVWKLVSPEHFGYAAPVFTTFALIFILFEGALNINLKTLFNEMFHGTLLTLINFILSVLAVTGVAWVMGFRLIYGVLLGIVLAGTSSAVVIPIVKNIEAKKGTVLMLTIESAISDVLCIVGAITLIKIIKLSSFDLSSVLNNVAGAFAIAIVIGAICGLFWTLLLQRIVSKHTRSYMLTIAFLLILYGVVEYIKSSGAIAALSFGLVLGNSKKIFESLNRSAENPVPTSAKFFYSEISFFVKSFFFVYLGILLDFTDVALLLWSAAITLLLFIIRPLAVYITVRKRYDQKERSIMSALVPKGLAAVVLAELPKQYGIKGLDSFSTIALMVVFFSILLSTVLVFLTEKDYFRGFGSMFYRIFRWVDRVEPEAPEKRMRKTKTRATKIKSSEEAVKSESGGYERNTQSKM